MQSAKRQQRRMRVNHRNKKVQIIKLADGGQKVLFHDKDLRFMDRASWWRQVNKTAVADR